MEKLDLKKQTRPIILVFIIAVFGVAMLISAANTQANPRALDSTMTAD